MGKKSKRQNLIVKICCIIASFALWLYIFNIENPIREQKITVPVNIINEKSVNEVDLALAPNETSMVTLVIKGNSSDIYSIKPTDFKLEADLSSFGLKKGENKIPVKVNKSPSTIKIVNEESLWVKIVLDKLKVNSVPVNIKLIGKPKEGYMAVNPIVDVKKVDIYGTETNVNKVKQVVGNCNIDNKSSEIKYKVPLQAMGYNGEIIKEVSIEPSKVYIQVPFKKVKRVSVNLKLSEDLKNNKNIESIVSTQSEVDISGEEEVIKSIKYLSTEVINVSAIKSGEEDLNTKLVLPKGVVLLNTNNIKVKIKFKNITENKENGEKIKEQQNIVDNNIIEKTMTKDITIINEPTNKQILLSQSSVVLTIKAKRNIINKLDTNNIRCYVDLKNAIDNDNVLKINVDIGDNSINYSINPDSIKVTIKGK